EWLVDNTRWALKPRTHESVRAALLDTAANYRKSIWRDEECRVQIWIEKDALSSVVLPVTDEYDVPLYPARGYSSITFLHDAALDIAALEVPVDIYHFGDFAPSGVNAAECTEDYLRDLAPPPHLPSARLPLPATPTPPSP